MDRFEERVLQRVQKASLQDHTDKQSTTSRMWDTRYRPSLRGLTFPGRRAPSPTRSGASHVADDVTQKPVLPEKSSKHVTFGARRVPSSTHSIASDVPDTATQKPVFQRSHASLPVMIRVLMVATMPLRLCIFSQQLHRCRICRQPVIMSCMSVTLRTPHGRQEINAHAAAMRNQVALIRKMNVTMTQMTHALACHMSVTTLRGLTARLCVVSKQLSKSASECYAFNIHMGHDVYTAVRVCACNTSV